MVHILWYIVRGMQCRYTVYGTVYGTQCTVYSVWYTVYGTLCDVHCVLYTVNGT